MSSHDSSSWEGDGTEHPKYYRPGGYHPVSIGDLYNDRYRIVYKLGWGYFSTVWLVYDYNEPSVFKALKIQKSEKTFTESALEEIEFFKPLNNKYVIKMLDSFTITGKFGTHWSMVFELCGPSLLSVLEAHTERGFPLHVVKMIINNIIAGIKCIHQKGIIHTDLKLDNILVSKPSNVIQYIIDNYKAPPKVTKQKSHKHKKMSKVNSFDNIPELKPYTFEDIINIKIADLGTAVYMNIDDKPTEIQTQPYMAPEIILGCPYDHKIDIWSIGCIAYELLTNETLFDCDSVSDCSIDSEENHLASIVETFGDIPQNLLDSGIYTYRYMNPATKNFIHIKKLIPQTLEENLTAKNRWTSEEVTEITKWLTPLLCVSNIDRFDSMATPSEC